MPLVLDQSPLSRLASWLGTLAQLSSPLGSSWHGPPVCLSSLASCPDSQLCVPSCQSIHGGQGESRHCSRHLEPPWPQQARSCPPPRPAQSSDKEAGGGGLKAEQETSGWGTRLSPECPDPSSPQLKVHLEHMDRDRMDPKGQNPGARYTGSEAKAWEAGGGHSRDSVFIVNRILLQPGAWHP